MTGNIAILGYGLSAIGPGIGVGLIFAAYLNGVAVGTATDSMYTTGNPGMGFNLETNDAACVGTNGDYGFTRFTATSN